MRLSLIALTLALPLAACGKDGGEAQNRDGSGMTADAISSNDITAIDAVTGEAANMAADVDYNADAANALENAAQNEMSTSRSSASTSPRSRPKPVAGDTAQTTPSTAAATPPSNTSE